MKRTIVLASWILVSAFASSAQTPSEPVVIGGLPAHVRASSELSSGKARTYSPVRAFDGDPKTAWVEGSPGIGSGEWIEFRFEKPVLVRTIGILNGYRKTPKLFEANGKIGSLNLRIDSSQGRLYSADEIGAETEMPVNRVAQSIRIVVDRAVRGSRYDDMSVSEIRLEVDSSIPDQRRIGDLILPLPGTSDTLVFAKGHLGIVSRREGKDDMHFDSLVAQRSEYVDSRLEFVERMAGAPYSMASLTLQYDYDRDRFAVIVPHKGGLPLVFLADSWSVDGSFSYKLSMKNSKVDGDADFVFQGSCSYPECDSFKSKVVYRFHSGAWKEEIGKR